LAAWLLGAQSLIPWHRRDFRGALELIDRGAYLSGNGSDATTMAWLHALRARACAGLGDLAGFESAYGQALEVSEYTNERDRRHGMDFSHGALDLRYYAGASWLLLGRPSEARPELNSSMAALPQSHHKARSVLTLALADAALQSTDIDHAVDLTRAALVSSTHQPIMPIMQQGRRLQRLLRQQSPEAAQTLDEPLRDFAVALASAGANSES
jgi:tetratricopeptide (TPR) repeat protein